MTDTYPADIPIERRRRIDPHDKAGEEAPGDSELPDDSGDDDNWDEEEE